MSQNLTVETNKVVADANQPRKYFDTAKMAVLEKSVKNHGILSPLLVEKEGDHFLLVDGERRFRAAKKLGLKEVPIIVIDSKDPVSRTIEQFHIQEMHEGWTPVEKAQVISELAQDLKKPFAEVCSMLGIGSIRARSYIALTKISMKDEYADKGISLDFAEPIIGVLSFVKNQRRENEESFTLSDQKKIEKMIIKNIADGEFTSRNDVVRLKDTFKSDPKTVKSFMDGENAAELFIKSKAKSAFHLRNIYSNSVGLSIHIKNFMDNPNHKLSNDTVTVLKGVRRKVTELLELAGQDD